MRERPEVMIIMRYFPRGIIMHAGVCGESKFVTAFGQLLDCLAFLHRPPEVFPFSKSQYDPPAAFGVMALDWLYGIPEPAPIPAQESVSPGQWRNWAHAWVQMLITHLRDQGGMDIALLKDMLVANQTRRLTAHDCLTLDLKNGLFIRRVVDGLVACAEESGLAGWVRDNFCDDPRQIVFRPE
ncbi:hypothetical protein C8A01DRAFT_41599 [Parachaetomium inaequale]|uniref:Uncharacterized protein n=1 Tax=Parachaetomium inaequale TaxID=2588326 RepID=A0AAN6SLQ5_9PEZI|nr:hypothetical protein C8A01DRAFT_41599 [Parachaetomium inaequale]